MSLHVLLVVLNASIPDCDCSPVLFMNHDDPRSLVGPTKIHRASPDCCTRNECQCPVMRMRARAMGMFPWVCFAHQSPIRSGLDAWCPWVTPMVVPHVSNDNDSMCSSGMITSRCSSAGLTFAADRRIVASTMPQSSWLLPAGDLGPIRCAPWLDGTAMYLIFGASGASI